MSGDRGEYRKIYPQIIEIPDFAFQQKIENASTLEEKQHFLALQEDVKLIRLNLRIESWPNNDLAVEIKEITSNIALSRYINVIDVDEFQELFDKELGDSRKNRVNELKRLGNVFTPSEISSYKSAGIDLKKIYIDIPRQRVSNANNLRNPFSMVDRNLKIIDFPIFQDLLDETHSYVARGHGWFGVGHWNAACKNYITALAKALATNNFVAVESIARFLVDNYAAAGDADSAMNLVNDYFQSSAYNPKANSKLPAEIIESLCIALALSNKWSESIKWLEKMPSILNRKINTNIETWRIIELLSDVYHYKKDNVNLLRLNKVTNALEIISQGL